MGAWGRQRGIASAAAATAAAAAAAAASTVGSFGSAFALSDSGLDLLNSMLTYDPAKRITAAEALLHPYFSEVPLAKDRALMPTFQSVHEGQRTVASKRQREWQP